MQPFILLCLLEGLAALIATLAGGFSTTRLAFAGLLVLILAGLAWLILRLRDGNGSARALEAIARPNIFRGLAVSSSLLFLASGLLLFLLRYLHPDATAPWFLRAWPLLTYLLLLGAQSSIYLIYLRNGIHPASLRERRGLFVTAGIVFGIFVVVWLFIALTGLGITPDPSYWGEPGIPILGWQLAVALLVGAGFLAWFDQSHVRHCEEGALPDEAIPAPQRRLLPEGRNDGNPPITNYQLPFLRADILIPLLIYLLAFGLWMSVPLTVLRNSFYAPIQPPYTQPFPNSDAALYDSNAQSLLLGYGFLAKIPTRPLFILFLAGLHALFGQEYARLIFGQTLLYALFPAALYFLGKRLHSRAAGVTVALLAIFRELTSLWVANDARVSNTKMLLSEFASMLALVAFLLVVLKWYERLKSPLQGQSLFFAFACGGLLGLQMLLRSQSMFVAPGIILLALFVMLAERTGASPIRTVVVLKKWVVQSVLFGAGAALAIAPWLARNYSVTGQLSLDDPAQVLSIASMYSGGTPTSNYDLFEGQSPSEIGAYVTDTILHRPGYVAGFVGNQFLGNLIDTLLVLPIFARYDGLSTPIYLYWYDWTGHPSAANIALFLVYLAVIAVGIAAAWKRLRWAGLLPLVFYLLYVFSTSLARYSGWRYIFPADWVGYFYFALGFIELATGVCALFGFVAQIANLRKAAPRQIGNLTYIAFAGLILFIGGLPWIVETRVPQRAFPCADSPVACLAERGANQSQAQTFLAQPGAVSLSGRVFYPRYYARNEGIASTNPSAAYGPRDYPRMGFYFFVGDSVVQAVLPMKGAHPFPHAADAIVLGCQREKFVEVKMIVFLDSGLTYISGALTDSCEIP
jgi:hypothetical protein